MSATGASFLSAINKVCTSLQAGAFPPVDLRAVCLVRAMMFIL
jgi:hypothetical protein